MADGRSRRVLKPIKFGRLTGSSPVPKHQLKADSIRRRYSGNILPNDPPVSSALSAYDDVAGMYDALWADWYLPAAAPALERLFFNVVPVGARVLDVCCGSGHVTAELVARGYCVTGVDNSGGLIELARARLPEADFCVQDVRQLTLEGRFEAALSTFDSLNHILSLDELREVFRRVRGVLEPGGRFVFDMNLEQAYFLDLRRWSVDVRDTSVSLVRGEFDAWTKRARTELIWFSRAGNSDCWRQQRSVVEQRCYSTREIQEALGAVGFREVSTIDAAEAGVTSDLGYGRVFFSAR
jgi:SAM-dependent methyltransferase